MIAERYFKFGLAIVAFLHIPTFLGAGLHSRRVL